MNIFEFATRRKLRFVFNGNLTVEDLWDLNEEKLDAIYRDLTKQKKQTDEESLLSAKTSEDQTLETAIAIVKHIFNVKKEEKQERANAKARREEKVKLMEILASKQDEELRNKSADEIRAMIEALD